MSQKDRVDALNYIQASIQNIHYNCTPYDITFVETPSIRRTLMPKAWSDHRMADEKQAAYERHPQEFNTVDRPSKEGSPNLLFRDASLDAEYKKKRSTIFIPIDGKASTRVGNTKFTFVFVEKWVAERIKNAREFLPPQYIVLYPEVMEIVPDFDRNTVAMNVFAIGSITSPNDTGAIMNTLITSSTNCPFFFGYEAEYNAYFDGRSTLELYPPRCKPWLAANDDGRSSTHISVNQRKKRVLNQDDDSEN